MKLTFLFSIAFLIGCASKPKTCDVNHFHLFDPLSSQMVCNGSKWVPVPEYGSISHVTRSQWEAAQGLYHSSLACNDRQHWKMITVRGDLPPGEYVKGWERDTFWYCAEGYPSGDAK